MSAPTTPPLQGRGRGWGTPLTDQLDIWTTATTRKTGAGRGGAKRVTLYGIDRLRALILDLAVRGKLVPPDAGDEPASALIPRLERERRERIEAGEIRDAKAPASRLTWPFELPAGWTWIALGMTGNIFSGNSINEATRARLAETLDGRPFVATKDIGYGRDPIDYDNGLRVPYNDQSFVVARSDAVFICAEGGSAGRKIAFSDREISFGNKLIANETWSVVEPRYVLSMYLSDFFFQQFAAEMTGIIGGISRAKFLALPFPLPPLAEQRRIVAKVDELMALCDALERESADALAAHQILVETLLATLVASPDATALAANWARLENHFDALFTTEPSIDALKATVLELAVRGKLSNTRAWPGLPVALKTVASLQNGFAFKSEWFGNEGVRLLRNINVSHGHVVWRETVHLSEDQAVDYARFQLNQGDIVLTLDRPFISTGTKVARIGEPDLPALLLQRVGRFLPSSTIAPDFLYLWISSPMFSEQIDPGRSNGVPHISSKQVESADIYLPPLAEQHRIVAKVDELMALCDALKARLADAAATQKHLADAIVERAAA